jgi:hypothetical protein
MFPVADGPFDNLDATGGRHLPDLTRKSLIHGWQIVALIGSLAMVVGVFVPFYKSRSLWEIGCAADGVPISATIIIGLAEVSIVLIVLRSYWALWLTGFAAFMVILLSSVGPGPTMPGIPPPLPIPAGRQNLIWHIYRPIEADRGWYLILFGAFLLIVGACLAAYVDYRRINFPIVCGNSRVKSACLLSESA